MPAFVTTSSAHTFFFISQLYVGFMFSANSRSTPFCCFPLPSFLTPSIHFLSIFYAYKILNSNTPMLLAWPRREWGVTRKSRGECSQPAKAKLAIRWRWGERASERRQRRGRGGGIHHNQKKNQPKPKRNKNTHTGMDEIHSLAYFLGVTGCFRLATSSSPKLGPLLCTLHSDNTSTSHHLLLCRLTLYTHTFFSIVSQTKWSVHSSFFFSKILAAKWAH